MAVVVAGGLLALTIAGAAWLTAARNRPIPLGQVHGVEGVPDVRIAWPEGWLPYRPPTRTGTPITAVADMDEQHVQRVLILLARRLADEAVPPDQAAAQLLEYAGRQLGFSKPISRQLMVTRGTMAELPAVQVSYPVRYQGELCWLQIRAICEANGRAIGLLLLSPEQISPADDRVMDAISESMQLSRSSPAKKAPPAEAEDEEPSRQPI